MVSTLRSAASEVTGWLICIGMIIFGPLLLLPGVLLIVAAGVLLIAAAYVAVLAWHHISIGNLVSAAVGGAVVLAVVVWRRRVLARRRRHDPQCERVSAKRWRQELQRRHDDYQRKTLIVLREVVTPISGPEGWSVVGARRDMFSEVSRLERHVESISVSSGASNICDLLAEFDMAIGMDIEPDEKERLQRRLMDHADYLIPLINKKINAIDAGPPSFRERLRLWLPGAPV